MKILMMHDFSRAEGGAGQLFFDERALLASSGHQVTVFTIGTKEDVQKNIYACDYIFEEPISPSLPYFFLKYFSFKLFFSFLRVIQQTKPDIVHLHNNLKSTISILLACKLAHIPIVHTMHDYNLACISSRGTVIETHKLCIRGSLQDCLRNRCFPMSKFMKHALLWKVRQLLEKMWVQTIICPSKYLYKILTDLDYKNIVHIDNFQIINKNERDTVRKTKKEYILFTGALTSVKGIPDLLRAFSIVKKNHEAINLYLIGSGPEGHTIRKLIPEYGIENRVKLIPRCNHDTLREYYQNATLQVVSSVGLENQPLVLLESMAFGIPTIATRNGGIPELIADEVNGLLYTIGDYESLAQKIDRLLKDHKLREQFRKASQYKIQTQFTPQRHMTQLLELYKVTIKNYE